METCSGNPADVRRSGAWEANQRWQAQASTTNSYTRASLVHDVQLLDGDLVDLVDDVDGGDVDTRPLDNVHQVVNVVVVRAVDVGVVNPVWRTVQCTAR